MNQKPNEYQIAGNHYQTEDKYQLWDLIIDIDLNFLLGNAVKYIYRCKNKNGIEDLEKAKHYIDKFFSLKYLSKGTGRSEVLLPVIKKFLDKEHQITITQKKLISVICHLTSFNTYMNTNTFNNSIYRDTEKYVNDVKLFINSKLTELIEELKSIDN
jgi:small nuclear ribonucleoprotein (snRNP)-like protein